MGKPDQLRGQTVVNKYSSEEFEDVSTNRQDLLDHLNALKDETVSENQNLNGRNVENEPEEEKQQEEEVVSQNIEVTVSQDEAQTQAQDIDLYDEKADQPQDAVLNQVELVEETQNAKISNEPEVSNTGNLGELDGLSLLDSISQSITKEFDSRKREEDEEEESEQADDQTDEDKADEHQPNIGKEEDVQQDSDKKADLEIEVIQDETPNDKTLEHSPEEVRAIVNYIYSIIEDNVVDVLASKYGLDADSSSESDQEPPTISVSTVPAQSPTRRTRANFIREEAEPTNPKKMILLFEKEDDEKIRAVKIDALHQSESLARRLAERRRKTGVLHHHHHGKRTSIFSPANSSMMSRSFFAKDIEDTLASDAFRGDHLHSFNVDTNDSNDFKEIFKVLDELEEDSNIFGNIDQPSSPEAYPQQNNKERQREAMIAAFEQKKKEAIEDVKKTYDDEIKKLKKQGKGQMIKMMIKNVKKEREEAVERVKEKFDREFEKLELS